MFASSVGIWTQFYQIYIRPLANPILLFASFCQFGIELCRVLWIDFSEKGKLHLKVTVIKKINVKKGTKDNRSYRRLKFPEALCRKEEIRGQNISTGLEENTFVASVRQG